MYLKRYLLTLLAALIVAAGGFAADRRTNVVLILADDLGYECIGANGGTSYKTPVLDHLAATGVRFTRCYAQPLCTPTRVQLMTGQYNVRNYTEFAEMDPKLRTFGHLFKDAGYATCVAGKWQLGHDPKLPQTFGFDEAYLWHHMRRPSRYRNPGLEIDGKPKDYRNGEYGPDVVSDFALGFIERNKAKPFFLYYPMMLTHGPYEPTPDSSDYGGRGTTRRQRQRQGVTGVDPHFADMVAYMDKLVGKLLARLDQLGLRENTLVLFVGDNGTGKGTRSMMGDKVVMGGKGDLTEAGMRVPLIAHWPGHMAASGKVCDDLVDSTDFLPTICEAAGVAVPAGWTLDGRSFLAQVRGEMGQPRKWYYCWYAPRDGRFKGEFAATAKYKLYRGGTFYDVAKDPEEQKPLRVPALEGEAAAAAKTLQATLDRYKDTRPEHLAKPAGK